MQDSGNCILFTFIYNEWENWAAVCGWELPPAHGVRTGENWSCWVLKRTFCWKGKTALETTKMAVLPKSKDVILLFAFNQYYWAVGWSPWCLFASAFPPFINSLGAFSSTWLFCSARKLAESFPCRCEFEEWSYVNQQFPSRYPRSWKKPGQPWVRLGLVLTWKGLCGNESLEWSFLCVYCCFLCSKWHFQGGFAGNMRNFCVIW